MPDTSRPRTQPPAVDPNYSEPLRTNPPRTPREPAGGGTFGDDPMRLPRTFEDTDSPRANPTANPMGTRPSPGAGDDPFRRARDAEPPVDDRDLLPGGARPGTTRPGGELPARKPGAGAGSRADDKPDMFLPDNSSGTRREGRKIESDAETTIPKKNSGAGDGTSREYTPGSSRPKHGTLSPIAKNPAPIASLDSKVTWRNVPERTRVKVRSGLAIPAVARSTNGTVPADPNSDWKPAGGATKLVRK